MEDKLRTSRISLLAVLVAGAVLAAWFLPSLLQIFLLIFAGVLLGNFFTHLTALIVRLTRLPYGGAYALVILSLLLLLGATAYYMGSRIAAQSVHFIEQLDQARTQVGSQFESQNWWQRLNRMAPKGQQGWAANQAVSTATSAAWSTLTVIGGIGLIAFLGFYFALQPDRYRNGLIVLFKPEARERMRDIFDRSADQLWRWVLGRLIGMLVIGVLSALGLWIMGIPLPVTLGVLAGILNFVPNIGPIIAGIPAVLFGLQQGTNVALYVLAFYFALQFVESYFLTPLIDQHQVSIPPGLMLSAQLVLGVIAGFLGLLLATPLTVLITILVNDLLLQKYRDSSAES